jgi:undecaprenyl-diphosphatase
VSSSGHLSVAQHFTSIDGIAEEGLFVMIVLHVGTLFAVLIAFRDTVWGMIREFFLTVVDIFTGKFAWSSMNDNRRMMFMVIIATALLVPASFVSGFFTAPMGDGDIIFEGVAFMFTAMLLFMADSCVKGVKTGDDMKAKDALTVGFFQVIALFPGVSRSGATISAGLFRGLSRKTAVTFSFMLSIPAVIGATVFEARDFMREGAVIDINPIALVLGLVVSMLVGLLAIRLVKLLIKREKFKIFAIYVMTIGVLCVIWGVFENITGITVNI